MSELRSCVVEAMIRGYHEYQSIWEADVGESLTCIREPGNVRDPYAVAVTKPESSTIVGHVPRKMSAICSLFLRKGGSISCQVSGGKRYSQDLPQGGLEIPCLLRFQGTAKDIPKVEKLATLALSSKSSSKPESPPSLEPPTKKVRVDADTPDNKSTCTLVDNANKENQSPPNKSDTHRSVKRVYTPSPSLKEEEYRRITAGEMLSDMSMDMAQCILKNQFPTLNGLQSTILQQKIVANSATGSELSRNSLQIIHSRSNHWILASTLGGEQVKVYDSLYESIDGESANVIFNLFHTSQVTMMNSCKQEGVVDCGVFAIANATAVAHGLNPETVKFIQPLMRKHLMNCKKHLPHSHVIDSSVTLDSTFNIQTHFILIIIVMSTV